MTALEYRNLFQHLAWGLGVCLLFSGWSQDANAPPLLKDALRLEAKTEHTVIGIRQTGSGEAGELDWLDPSGGEFITLRFYKRGDVSAASMELTKNDDVASSDKQWVAHCDKRGECRINKVAEPGKSFSVSRKNVVTPLYWSPDEGFVLLVRQVIWGNPLRCSLEDQYNIIVYDIAQGRAGIVTTVCGGFPYLALRWYRLP